MGPLVSVIIPTRDRPDTLHEAINSVKAQTFTNYEIIVVINGPKNPQTAKISEIATAAGCGIIRIEQAGIAVALNSGVRAAQGRWLAFLDDDDLWEPRQARIRIEDRGYRRGRHRILRHLHIRRNHLRPRCSAAAAAFIVRQRGDDRQNYGGGCSSTMLKRAAMLAAGGFRSIVSPDWDMWMRLSWRYRVAWADAYLVRVRRHQQNTSKQISWAYWTLYIQYKALKTLPPELRHLRRRILLQMLRGAMKGVERYVRLNYLRRFRKWRAAS